MSNTGEEIERVLILVKPEAMQEPGKVLAYFDRAKLKLIKAERIVPAPKLIEEHYQADPDWLEGAGGHWVKGQAKLLAAGETLAGTIYTEAKLAGQHLRELLIDNYADEEIVAAIYEGVNAVKVARGVCGHTDPSKADAGTVRGDLSKDSGDKATAEDRPIRNCVHVSSSVADANREIKLWFSRPATSTTTTDAADRKKVPTAC